jgi:hypothetical protein
MSLNTPTDRRRFRRQAVNVRVLLCARERFQIVTVSDFSPGGLRLEGTSGLVVQDQVEIHLLSGGYVFGTVAWSTGITTGIVFLRPLSAMHPVMIELERKSPLPCAVKATSPRVLEFRPRRGTISERPQPRPWLIAGSVRVVDKVILQE